MAHLRVRLYFVACELDLGGLALDLVGRVHVVVAGEPHQLRLLLGQFGRVHGKHAVQDDLDLQVEAGTTGGQRVLQVDGVPFDHGPVRRLQVAGVKPQVSLVQLADL